MEQAPQALQAPQAHPAHPQIKRKSTTHNPPSATKSSLAPGNHTLHLKHPFPPSQDILRQTDPTATLTAPRPLNWSTTRTHRNNRRVATQRDSMGSKGEMRRGKINRGSFRRVGSSRMCMRRMERARIILDPVGVVRGLWTSFGGWGGKGRRSDDFEGWKGAVTLLSEGGVVQPLFFGALIRSLSGR